MLDLSRMMINDVQEFLWKKAKACLMLVVFFVMFSIGFILHWQRISVTRIDSQREYYVNPADLKAVKYVFGKNGLGLERLQVTDVRYSGEKVSVVHARRMYQGVPVSGADLVYFFNHEGELDWENEGIVGYGGVLQPTVSISVAAAKARWYSKFLDELNAELVLFAVGEKGPEWRQEYRLAWEFTSKGGLVRIDIDARNGKLLFVTPKAENI